MRDFFGTLLGKSIRLILSFRPGGGQALPGLIIEKLLPAYVSSMLSQLPEGIVIITGTNGKTTTTKIITELLKANGKRVLTNPTGSNLIRGIASALAAHASMAGKLNYDLAILEVDEATARKLVNSVKPRWVIGLNVSRDQLDRFGEIDTIAAYLRSALEQAQVGVIVNANDPQLLAVAKSIQKPVHYFGTAAGLKKYFPSDYELAAVDTQSANQSKAPKLDVELANFEHQRVTYKIAGKKYKTNLKLSGQHNFLNAAAALVICLQLLTSTEPDILVRQLGQVSLAFGRGEKYRLPNGSDIELVLVKNPASFTQALASYNAKQSNLMIAINDNIADSRDVSWLWDVNFDSLGGQSVLLTSGQRAADMALRLSYDDIQTKQVEPNLSKALKILSTQSGPKVILATYTAMLQLYGVLSKRAKLVI